MQDVGHHQRRLERRLRESSELRAEFERQQQSLAAAGNLRSGVSEEPPTMRRWLSDSETWQPVDVGESATDTLAAERERRGLSNEDDGAG